MAEKKQAAQEMDLESAMKRLDEVVASISAENVSLEDALCLYEEGVALVRCCSAKLEEAERKINVLRMSADGEVTEAPFDVSAIG